MQRWRLKHPQRIRRPWVWGGTTSDGAGLFMVHGQGSPSPEAEAAIRQLADAVVQRMREAEKGEDPS